MNAAPPPDTGSGDGAQPTTPGDRRGVQGWVRTVIVVLAVAVLVTVIVVDRHTLAESLSAIGGLDLRWFALAIVCECLSLTAFGLSGPPFFLQERKRANSFPLLRSKGCA